jgi:LacI family transcriptional regulator
MTSTAKTAATPTILYVDYSPNLDSDRRRLDGMRRYASARKWAVETLDHADCSPDTLREALARIRPIGCAAECWCPETAMRPTLFGRVPVVYFSPPDRPGWRNARGVSCDEAAVARMAFAELSAGNPSSYAVLSCWEKEPWARERIDAFRECCREAGASCKVTYFTARNAAECPMRAKLMVPWAAALPPHCAVFAVNDCCARCAAKAMAAAGRPFPRTVTLVGADGAAAPSNDRELAETVSSVRLDFELAGYLAAKTLGSFLAAKDAKNSKSSSAVFANSVFFAAKKTGNAITFPPLLVARRKSTRGYGRREPRILEAMEMIRREACDGLTVAALAARFHGSRRLFDMRFREAAGHSALDEILNVRLARAMELLVHTDIPIASVAHFSGFNTELEFWKLFSKRTGMPPLRFRDARRKPPGQRFLS